MSGEGSAADGEFQRIAQLFRPLATDPAALGLADDAALVTPPPGARLVIAADALVAGVHFFPEDPPDLVARKALRVNLSDLAAMGATPYGYLQTLQTSPAQDWAWCAAYAAGLAQDQARFGVTLLGGDSVRTSGPLAISITALGWLSADAPALTRAGAQVGDEVWVTGTLGDAAFGLAVAQGRLTDLDPADAAFFLDRYRLPQPRLVEGVALRGLATAALDVSDGLIADLQHIADASRVGMEILAAAAPLSPAAARRVAQDPDQALPLVLGGGDDYELAFTAPPAAVAQLLALGATRIGRVVRGAAVAVITPEGHSAVLDRVGWRHF